MFGKIKLALCFLAASALLCGGCDAVGGKPNAEKPEHFCQELAYADGIFPAAGDLGAGWRELGRAAQAYTDFGKHEADSSGDDGAVPESPRLRKLLKPSGPCGICAGVAYARGEGDGAAAEATVLYLFERYPALKLCMDDEMPNINVPEWRLGRDGIAVAEYVAAARDGEVASSLKKGPTAGGKDEPQDEDKPEEKVEATADGEAAAPAAESDKEGSAAAAEAPEQAESQGKADTAEEQAETAAAPAVVPVADAAEEAPGIDGETEDDAAAAEVVVVPVAAERKSGNACAVGEKVVEKGALAVAGAEKGCTYYLAGRGVLVKVWSAYPAGSAETEKLLAAVRGKLASAIARDERIHSELARNRQARMGKIKVEALWNPNADVYWRVLDFAIGGTVYKKKW